MKTEIKKQNIKIKWIFPDRPEIIPPDKLAKSRWNQGNWKQLGFIFWEDGDVSICDENQVRYALDKKVWKQLKKISEMKKYKSP